MDKKIVEKTEQNPKARNVGFDILRIISMIMIVTLHYLGKGGLLEIENTGKIDYIIYSIMETLAIVAVNCYILISGYFLVKSEFKIKKFMKLWGEVIFYSITIYLILIIIGLKRFNISEAIQSVFPVVTKQYWFINVYFAMYLLSPYLNKLIHALKQDEHRKLLFIIIILFSVMTMLPSEWTLDDTSGYGIIWFICLYIISAYIRIYISGDTINKYHNKFLLVYISSAILIFGVKLVIQYICYRFNINDMSGKMWAYNNPLVLIESLSLFLYFSSIKIKNKSISKKILSIAPLTFAVYLIHEHIALRTILYKNILKTEICYHNHYGILIVLFSTLLIFSICIFIEYIRKRCEDNINKGEKFENKK